MLSDRGIRLSSEREREEVEGGGCSRVKGDAHYLLGKNENLAKWGRRCPSKVDARNERRPLRKSGDRAIFRAPQELEREKKAIQGRHACHPASVNNENSRRSRDNSHLFQEPRTDKSH